MVVVNVNKTVIKKDLMFFIIVFHLVSITNLYEILVGLIIVG